MAKKKTNQSKSKSKAVHIKAPYPHFRYYKKSRHPALIVGEKSDEYRYRKVMHDDTEGGRNNEKVYPNPNKRDPKPMYIAKRVRHDKQTHFGNRPYSWKYPGKK